MGFFGNIFKGAKKLFTHVKDKVLRTVADKIPALVGAA